MAVCGSRRAGIVAGERPAGDRQLARPHRPPARRSRPSRSCRTAAGRARRARRPRRRGPTARCVSASVSAGSGETRSSRSAQRLVPGAAVGDRERPRAYAINGRVDDGPVAPAAAHSPSGPALDAACRAMAALPPHAGARRAGLVGRGCAARRVTYVRREALAAARRALARAPRARLLRRARARARAGARGGRRARRAAAGRPSAIRPDGGPLVQVPLGSAGPADDVHGLGVLLLSPADRAQRAARASSWPARSAPAAEAAALLQSLLAPDPAARPGLGAPGRGAARRDRRAPCPDTTPAAASAAPPRAPRPRWPRPSSCS